MRCHPSRGRVHGQGTSEHITADEDGAGGAASRFRRRNEGAEEDCSEWHREAAQAEDAADIDGQQGTRPIRARLSQDQGFPSAGTHGHGT